MQCSLSQIGSVTLRGVPVKTGAKRAESWLEAGKSAVLMPKYLDPHNAKKRETVLPLLSTVSHAVA